MKWLLLIPFSIIALFTRAQIITTIAGDGTPGYSGDYGLSLNAKFEYPIYLCLDKGGNLYISDVLNNAVRKIQLNKGIITTVAGTGVAGYSGDGGQASTSQIFMPQGIHCDELGNIFFADATNYRIRKITVSTGIINTVVGTGVRGNSGDGGPATNARVDYAHGLFVDKLGNIYFTDANVNVVRKVDASGIITTVAGRGGVGYTGDGGAATAATFNSLAGIALDDFGNIFIADCYNHAIRRIASVTGIVTTVAGRGTPGYSGDGGPATNAKLNEPCGIFIDKNNDVYFGEYPNGVIRKITTSTGIINTVVGCGNGYSGDGGLATKARLVPSDLSIDSSGTMYIADLVNYRVRKVFMPDSITQVNICVGDSSTLIRNMPNGKWVCSDPEIAVVDTIFDKAIGIKPGTVSITHLDSIFSEKFAVTVHQLPAITSNVSPVTCYGFSDGSIATTASGGTGSYQYFWQTGDSSSLVNNLSPGVYRLQVSDRTTECTIIDTFTVTQPDSIVINAEISSKTCKAVDQKITISVEGGVHPYQYVWSNNSTSATVSGLEAGTYNLTVTDNNNCSRNTSFVLEDTCSNIVVNDGISPNGDGINDTWIIDAILDYPNNNVQVFNKWGAKVFEETGYKNDWNCEQLPDGTYFYLVKPTPISKTVLSGALLIKR